MSARHPHRIVSKRGSAIWGAKAKESTRSSSMCLQEGQARKGFEKLHMNVELPNDSLAVTHSECTTGPLKKGLLSHSQATLDSTKAFPKDDLGSCQRCVKLRTARGRGRIVWIAGLAGAFEAAELQWGQWHFPCEAHFWIINLCSRICCGAVPTHCCERWSHCVVAQRRLEQNLYWHHRCPSHPQPCPPRRTAASIASKSRVLWGMKDTLQMRATNMQSCNCKLSCTQDSRHVRARKNPCQAEGLNALGMCAPIKDFQLQPANPLETLATKHLTESVDWPFVAWLFLSKVWVHAHWAAAR